MPSQITVIIPINLSETCQKAAFQVYYDGIIANYLEYVSEAGFGNSPQKAEKIAHTRETALDNFAKMRVPKAYSDRHGKLMIAAKAEREWDKVLLNYANEKIDFNSLITELKQVHKTGRSEFTTKCYEIITALNHEPSVTPSEYGLKLEKLNEMFS